MRYILKFKVIDFSMQLQNNLRSSALSAKASETTAQKSACQPCIYNLHGVCAV